MPGECSKHAPGMVVSMRLTKRLRCRRQLPAKRLITMRHAHVTLVTSGMTLPDAPRDDSVTRPLSLPCP
jgi:hypothetical protein